MADAIPAQNPPARKPLTHERLREVLRYDPETGIFTWRINIYCGNGRAIVMAGDVAGHKSVRRHTTYIVIGIDGCRYMAHDLAVFHVEGDMPRLVDHEDRDGVNNRWENLRRATKSQNGANQCLSPRNKFGLKGVMRDKHGKKWVAQIQVDGKSKHLGTFKTPEEAHAAYVAAAERHFGEFARAQ